MAIFKYKRIKRQGKYFNTIFKDGKFFQFDKWDKEHHKLGAIERGKSRRRIEMRGRRKLPTAGRPDKEILEEIQFTQAEDAGKARHYQVLGKRVRSQIAVDWSKVKSKETFNILVKELDLKGSDTRKRRLALQYILKIKFEEKDETHEVAFFKIKKKTTMRYRDKKGRFVKR